MLGKELSEKDEQLRQDKISGEIRDIIRNLYKGITWIFFKQRDFREITWIFFETERL